MTHRNRVDPFGRLQAVPERGLLYGNRGVLHDRHGTVVRERSSERRWISCLLEFKGRRRDLLQPGRYTELFFLDEATALAAGHRPCLECRRADGTAFLTALAAARPDLGRLRVGPLDALVDPDRLTDRPLTVDPLTLPDGTMVAGTATTGAGTATTGAGPGPGVSGGDRHAAAYLIRTGRLWRWSPAGYQPAEPTARPDRLLTPALFVAALAGGYRPLIHPSAA